MSDIQIKEKIDKMYEKSLFFNHEDSCKSIRLIQATKSLIGININEPLLNLLDYTEGLVNSIDKEKPQILNEKFDLPEMVSYKNLSVTNSSVCIPERVKLFSVYKHFTYPSVCLALI